MPLSPGRLADPGHEEAMELGVDKKLLPQQGTCFCRKGTLGKGETRTS